MLGVLVLAVVGGVLLFVTRDQPGEHSVDDALEEFRGDGGPDGDDDLAHTRPAPGVYPAEGEGEAALGLLGLTQSDGPSIPVTVAHESDGCWSVAIALNQAHRQVNRLCRDDDDGAILDAGGETQQAWDLGAVTQDNRTEFGCEEPAVVDDPDAEPGASWTLTCTGTNTGIDGATTSSGPTTFVGVEGLDVGGEQVQTRHLRQERTLTGAQEGEQVVDHWYAVDTGMLVREERRSAVTSQSPVGAISYTEEGWWQLTSLEPRT